MKSPNEDIDLVIGLNNGNEKALDAFFRHFYQALCFFAVRIIKDKDQAEDIVIGSFSKLWNRRADFESYQNVKGFLYITTRNGCFDFLRQAHRAQSAQDEFSYLFSPEEEQDIEAERTKAEVLRKIYEEIEKLPKQCREVFELSVFEGLKSKDIAERMNISVSNVTSQKSRAVQLLRTAVLKKLLSWIFLW